MMGALPVGPEGEATEPLHRTGASPPRRILAFDGWTQGSPHLERLVAPLQARGYDLLLVHIGSWGHDPGRPLEEKLGPLLARDISFYGKAKIPAILDREAPAAVLFLSTQALVHRAVIRHCRLRGIPTYHLLHGLMNVVDPGAKRLNPVNWRSQAMFIRRAMGRNLRHVWPTYVTSLLRSRATPRDWATFAHSLVMQVQGRPFVGAAPEDATTDGMGVFVEADVAYGTDRYHVPPESIQVVGNPDLMRFGLQPSDLGACLSPQRATTVVYVDTGLVAVGAGFANDRDFVEHVVETRDALRRQDLDLMAKLHPAHGRTTVPRLLEEAGIPTVQNFGFLPALRNAAGAIVEPSAAALIPELLGLPVLLAQYGRLREQAYGPLATSYPRSRTLKNLGDAASLLEQARGTPPGPTEAWIRANVGPLPASAMPDRVADALDALVRHKQGGVGRTRPPDGQAGKA